jgi:putative transposase
MILPQRRILGHTSPSGIPDTPVYFVTICGKVRGQDQFCQSQVAGKIFESVAFYHERKRWWMHLMLLMPDHIHCVVRFPVTESMSAVIRAWKHYLATQRGISWQRDFFDHRLRTRESYDEKASYIRQNPVRAGLVKTAVEWPYIWESRR